MPDPGSAGRFSVEGGGAGILRAIFPKRASFTALRNATNLAPTAISSRAASVQTVSADYKWSLLRSPATKPEFEGGFSPVRPTAGHQINGSSDAFSRDRASLRLS